MSHETVSRLFDNWERVWNENRHDLIAQCVADVHVRHDGAGTRQMTPQQYVEEIVTAKQNRPNTHVVVYDHEIAEDRAWFRFGLTWHDAVTSESRTRAGMALWRIEQDRMAESWLALLALGSTWPDAKAQTSWTSR
jgi:hypothetical protein